MSGADGPTLQSELRDRLRESPGRPALAFYGGRDWRWLDRAEVEASAAAVAHRLADAGAEAGEVCLLVLPSGRLASMATLGSLMLGAVPLLVAPPFIQGDHSSLPRILRHVVERTGARLVVGDERSLAHGVEEATGDARTLRLDDADAEPSGSDSPEWVEREPADVAAMQLTSGTTGLPRVCVWDHRAVLAALDGMVPAMALSGDDVCCNWTPLYHDMGLVNNFLLCLAKGVPLVLLSPTGFVRRPALWPRALSETGSTITWSPNFGFAITADRCADDELEGVRLDGVRALWNAAERIHLGTMDAFHRRFEPYGLAREALKTNFGCAENVGGATFSDPTGTFVHETVDRWALEEDQVARPPADGDASVDVVGVGRPRPDTGVRIVGPDGKTLPDGRVGEIALDTPSRFREYLGDPEATARARRGGILHTGDLGYVRDGEVFWVGRTQERITIHGRKFDPSDFEWTLLGIEGLREGCFAAFGIDDPEEGTQSLVLVSETRDGGERTVAEVAADVRSRIFSTFGLRVADVVLVPSGTLTKTSSGKRRHNHFRRLYLESGLGEYRLN